MRGSIISFFSKLDGERLTGRQKELAIALFLDDGYLGRLRKMLGPFSVKAEEVTSNGGISNCEVLGPIKCCELLDDRTGKECEFYETVARPMV